MKPIIYVLLTITTLTFVNSAQAQNADHPFKFSFGTHAVDYNIDSSYFSDLFDTSGVRDWNFDAIINRFTFGGSMNKSFSLQGSVSAMTISKNLLDKTTRGSLWLDADVTLNYHLANGYILKERSCIDPYLFAGAGLNYLQLKADNHAVIFEPKFGLGFDFWLSEQIGLFVQTGYTWQGGDHGTDYAQHAIGVIFRFGKGTDTDGDGIADYEDACPDKAGIAKFNGCPDTDGDGITDAMDACPAQAGLLEFQGCPDSDGDGIADKDDACPNDKGLSQFAGCPDTDGDGIADKDDRCPKDKGLSQFQGCPDTDGDGIGDLDDNCPKEKGLKQFNGCPDTDGDGITDKEDRCPKEKGTMALKGCPDVDGDGVADIDDKCPDKVGPSTNHGCPVIDDKTKAEITKKISFAAKSIQFETNSDVIKKSSNSDLDNIVSIMKLYPSTSWMIEGHTDDVGADDFNMDLSNRRAAAIKKYFTDKGVDASRLSSQGYGETKPVASNKTATGRSQNRRVEIKLVDQK